MTPDAGRKFLGHPRGLVTCFGTEFFERFTYYGMRTCRRRSGRGHHVAEIRDSELTGTEPARFMAVHGRAYLLARPGGWIADRLIGQRNAVLSGA